MQDADRGRRFKTLADSVQVIGELGERLTALQADVSAIEGLPVDDNGDAEAIVNISSSRSLHMLRIPPSAMLLAKGGEIARVITALKTEFIEFLDHGEVLLARCSSEAPAALAAPRKEIDLYALERMTPDTQEETNAMPAHEPGHAPDRNRPAASWLRPRVSRAG